MGAISGVNSIFCGSHCGISIGQDGASQMGLEDLSIFCCLPDSTVLYPSDAVSTERAVELVANLNKTRYIRTSRYIKTKLGLIICISFFLGLSYLYYTIIMKNSKLANRKLYFLLRKTEF